MNVGNVDLSGYTVGQLEEAAVIFDKAHDVLLEAGWTKPLMLRPMTGRNCDLSARCVESAVGYAATGSSYYKGMAVLAVQPPEIAQPKWAMDLKLPHIPQWLAALTYGMGMHHFWNDLRTTTEDMVFDRLREAAKACREEVGRREQERQVA